MLHCHQSLLCHLHQIIYSPQSKLCCTSECRSRVSVSAQFEHFFSILDIWLLLFLLLRQLPENIPLHFLNLFHPCCHSNGKPTNWLSLAPSHIRQTVTSRDGNHWEVHCCFSRSDPLHKLYYPFLCRPSEQECIFIGLCFAELWHTMLSPEQPIGSCISTDVFFCFCHSINDLYYKQINKKHELKSNMTYS